MEIILGRLRWLRRPEEETHKKITIHEDSLTDVDGTSPNTACCRQIRRDSYTDGKGMQVIMDYYMLNNKAFTFVENAQYEAVTKASREMTGDVMKLDLLTMSAGNFEDFCGWVVAQRDEMFPQFAGTSKKGEQDFHDSGSARALYEVARKVNNHDSFLIDASPQIHAGLSSVSGGGATFTEWSLKTSESDPDGAVDKTHY